MVVDEYEWRGDGKDPFVDVWEETKDNKLICWYSYIVFPPPKFVTETGMYWNDH